jgi:(1->4)-alpha-D-glucan 1-alpha-D-glucosylmutase
VAYLRALGIGRLYASPWLRAAPGSRHGYDVVDHGALNPALGTREQFDAFIAAAGRAGLGVLADIVPNHMRIDPEANAWWRDVLEHGQSSMYAPFFDIDWNPVKAELGGKVLLPILDRQYGQALEAGQLALDVQEGAIVIRHGAGTLPVDPRTAPAVLGFDIDAVDRPADDPDLMELLSVIAALRNLPAEAGDSPALIADRRRETDVARRRLATLLDTDWVRAHVARAIAAHNGQPGDPRSFDRLHALLEAQAYRLAYWRTSAHEINYRRFFDVDELAGLRMEDERVFEATHLLLRSLIDSGAVTGLRVDHPDGLAQPAEYFDRLQALGESRRDPVGGLPIYIVAEKILTSGQELPEDWRVHGTTGYAFMNAVTGLLVPPRNVAALRRAYRQFTGRRESWADVAYLSKKLVMETSLASELNVLAHALNRLSERNRRSRDFTLNSLRRALREFVACLAVYRTYVSAAGRSAADEDRIFAAIAEARRRNPALEASIFDFLAAVLVDAAAAPPERSARDALAPYAAIDDDERAQRLRFTQKLQQYTGPVHAKRIEDTAFYRYNVLLALNEVGGQPSQAAGLAEFHAQNARRQARWPLEMTATATHDSKLGEDVRARIAVIAEIPDRWRAAVGRFGRLTGRLRTRVLGEWAPDRNDEYRFYQVLVGMWPPDARAAADPAAAAAALAPRLSAFMLKSIKEAKIHTSWINDNEAYDAAVERFVRRSLEGPASGPFLAALAPLATQVARAGMVNSLAQLVLKIGAPGVPDFYQGTELWDLRLVDPDNRGLVDYAARAAQLGALEPLLAAAHEAVDPPIDAVRELLAGWSDGRIKLFVTAAGLRARAELGDLFLSGRYAPIESAAHGTASVVAFARDLNDQCAVIAVARHTADLIAARDMLPVADAWAGHLLPLPAGWRHRRLVDTLTGRSIAVGDAGGDRPYLDTASVLGVLPVAMLVSR